MNLTLHSIEKDGVVRLTAEGAITAEDFKADEKSPLEKLLGEQWAQSRVLMNMAKTSYIDSSAVGWLLSCQKKFKEQGGILVLHTIPPSIRQIFDLLKVGMIVPVVDDEAEALERAQQEA